ncbi:MAG: citrate/2-methylcitrate synthase [Deltaproteobacteria bacterium]|nr:citrate/2-methylcitrate synthase [Deltaproteobacteria bacterium]
MEFGEIQAAPTQISNIREGKLRYRGILLEDLVSQSSFEEVVLLLWNGKLPLAAELKEFSNQIQGECGLDSDWLRKILNLRNFESAIDFLIAALSLVSTGKNSNHKIFFQLPPLLAAWENNFQKKNLGLLSKNSSIAAYFLNSIRESNASDLEIVALDKTMLIHADHELNISTFGLRLAASTGSDFVSSVIAALGILKGPLHGGASEWVMKTFDQVKDKKHVSAFLDQAFKNKEKIMGFGHLLYKNGDPRAKALKNIAKNLSAHLNRQVDFEMAEAFESEMLKRKNLHPNIDFYSGCVYRLLGFRSELGPGVFAMSRMAGWVAHYEEQNSDRRIVLARGLDEKKREDVYIPLSQRTS